MNSEILNLLCFSGASLLVGFAFFLMFTLLFERPALCALLSLLIFVVGFGLFVSEVIEQIYSVIVMLMGGIFLIFSGFTYNLERGES